MANSVTVPAVDHNLSGCWRSVGEYIRIRGEKTGNHNVFINGFALNRLYIMLHASHRYIQVKL